MPTAENVRTNLTFNIIENGLLSYQITNGANGDSWRTIKVIYNARTTAVDFTLDDTYNVAILGDNFDMTGAKQARNTIKVPAISMAVLYKD